MRFYSIDFSGQGNFGASGVPKQFTSALAGGDGFNPGALEIEFDIMNGLIHDLVGPMHLRIYNVSRDILDHCHMYQGMAVAISAGFADGPGGFPLAIPYSSKKLTGIIATGIVFNVFSNYVGTEMAIDFVIYPSVIGNPRLSLPSGVNAKSPLQIDFTWGSGTSFIDSINNALKPSGLEVKGRLNDKLKNNNTGHIFTGHYATIQAFQEFLIDKSKSIVAQPTNEFIGIPEGGLPKYNGVHLWWDNTSTKTIVAYDGAEQPGNTVSLLPSDFIGQPTWSDYPTEIISIHPLRCDITMGSIIKYPEDVRVTVLSDGFSPYRKQINAAGNEFFVKQVRHVGKFRDPGYQSWCTYVWAFPKAGIID